ncbi:MAG: ROK family protein [Nevskiales bacterium]
MSVRIGVDLGGTKIEAIVLAGDGNVLARRRVPTPSDDYAATLGAITTLVHELEAAAQRDQLPIGICTPGAISPSTGRLKNANSTCLNGKPFKQDIEAKLQRRVRIANDADCLAMSEAVDGAGAGARSVFAVILGTGVGGGIVFNKQLVTGPNAIAGEWGHNPLPWPKQDFSELPGRVCYCGKHGCIETWLSGPGLAADFGEPGLPAAELLARAETGDGSAQAALSRYEDRLARGLASVINVLDPEIIVLGGGLSNITRLYDNVPRLWDQYVFSDRVDTRLVKATHGDSSGVRGAAWLWPEK